MHELSKSVPRRLATPGYVGTYFVGDGIDIGGAPDPLAQYTEQFPLIRSVRVWDLKDGDAQDMAGIADNTFDFVHSSHCLEHLADPFRGFANWFRILKPGGHLVVLVPDEDLYEQGVFPSAFNSDHKFTFTIYKAKSWSKRSVNMLDLVRDLGPSADPVLIQQLNSTFRYRLRRFDQTLTPIGECAIDLVIRKRLAEEVRRGGRWAGT